MSKKAIIYDFDGTIADTLFDGVDIYNEIAARRGFTQVTPENKVRLRGQGTQEALKELGVSFFSLPLLLWEMNRKMKLRIPGIKPYPGMKEVVAELKRNDYFQGIATSNSLENVQKFITGNDLSGFGAIKSGFGLFGKAKLIRKIISENKLDPRNVIYLGDETRDIEAAKKAGVKSVAVTWGINSETALAALKPDFIARKPGNILTIVGISI